jgi:fructose-1,6-bisphosphatase/inositol monophosphatase family enzyme
MAKSWCVKIKKNDLRKSTVSFIRGHRSITDPKLKKEGDELEMFIKGKFRRILEMWCPVLDWGLLAEGRIDAIISFEDEPQEEFAGTLLAKEAGLKVCNFDGNEYNGSDHKIIACTDHLVDNLIKLKRWFNSP